MRHTRRELLGMAAAGSTGLIAGCTGASGTAQETTTEEETETMTTTRTTEATTERTAQETGYTVEVRTHPEHGVILTDAEGMTLYLFTQDEEGESVCYDDCAEAWPPLIVEGEPSIPEGIPGEFGTTERDDGSMQVTYNGMPLYYFQNDQEEGDVTGQGVNDVWFVLNPTCEGATGTMTGTTTEAGSETTTDSGDGMYDWG